MYKRNDGFGLPDFPKRGDDSIGKIQDRIYAEGLLAYWGDACPSPSPEILKVIEEGVAAETEAQAIPVDNRGEV